MTEINLTESKEKMKTNRKKVMILALATAVATSITITPVVLADATPTFGAKCTTLGQATGTKATDLVCAPNAAGVLHWSRLRLSLNGAAPVAAMHAPKGTIEFYHWRPEDKAIFADIITKFEADNPGTVINQVIMSSVDYTNLAYSKISKDPKAALFVTSRGGQFNQFMAGNQMRDITADRYVQQNVIGTMLPPATVGGKIYGIPYQLLLNDPLYNIAMFAKNNWTVPTNLTQVLSFCKTAKAAGVIPIALPGATAGNAGQIMNSVMMNAAPDLATLTAHLHAIDTGKEKLSDPWFTTNVAGVYKQMADAGCFPANLTGYNDTSASADFANGKAAIYPTGTFQMSTVKTLNPAMKGNIGLMSFIATNSKPVYSGIYNDTFILSVNAKASVTDQLIARAFLSYLTTAPIAQEYALGSSQHVTIPGVDYTANVDLANTASFLSKNLLLAPRFIFNNVGTVRNPMEAALVAIAGGADVTSTLAKTDTQIQQGLSG